MNAYSENFEDSGKILDGLMSEFYQGILQGVPKNLPESREEYIIVVSRFSSVFSECLTRDVINAAG